MNSSPGKYVLLIVSPILALVVALTRLRELDSRNIIWLFCSYYGMAFYYNPELGVDSVYYVDALKEMHESELTFESLTAQFYSEGERHYDIFAPLVTFFVSRFTEDYRVFFGVIGFVFGYFYSRFLYFFIDRADVFASSASWTLMAALAFSLDVGTGINGVRMYTAMYVFLLGLVQYCDKNEIRHLLLAACSVFFHFSFLFAVAILLLTIALQKFHFMAYIYFLLSFVVAELDIALIRSIVEALPLGLEGRVAGYLAGRDREGLTWLWDANFRMLQVFMVMIVSYLYIVVKHERKLLLLPLVFAMALYGTVNLASQVGSIARFYVIAQVVVIGYFCLAYSWKRFTIPMTETIANLAAFLLLLQITLGVRFFFGFATTHLVTANPVLIWFLDRAGSLYDLVPRFW